MKTANQQIQELKTLTQIFDLVNLKQHITDNEIKCMIDDLKQLQDIRKAHKIKIIKL